MRYDRPIQRFRNRRSVDEGAKSFVSSWNDPMEVIASKSASLAKTG